MPPFVGAAFSYCARTLRDARGRAFDGYFDRSFVVFDGRTLMSADGFYYVLYANATAVIRDGADARRAP